MININGIVLKRVPFRDHDAIISIVTPERMFSFLARGVDKITSKNTFSVSPYSLSNFELMKTKEGLSLKTGKLINSYSHAKDNLDTLAVLDFISEITFRLLEDGDYPSLFESIKKILELLDQGFHPKTLAIIYFATILNAAGYGWNVDSCQKCGSKASIVAINPQRGGFICRECFEAGNGVKLTPRELNILRYIFKVTPNLYEKTSFINEECTKVISILDHFVLDIVDIQLKSTKLLIKL